MKKSYLMIAAAAALFAACSQNDEIKEISTQGPAIGFASYTQKATRAENSSAASTWLLEDHHNAFKVWGFKNNSSEAVFFNVAVTHQTTPEGWTYTNNRYWDKASTDYYFYACAPSSETTPFVFNGATTALSTAAAADVAAAKASQPNGYFTIPNAYTLAGENVSAFAKSTVANKTYANASTNKIESWTSAGATTDVDLMIAEACHLTGNSLDYSDVQLNFIHILSRLNITAKTVSDKGFYPGTGETANSGDKIVINNITIGNIMTSGTFNENATFTGNLDAGQYARWTTTTKDNYSYNIDYLADQNAKYVIEALILPQVLETETIKEDGTGTINKPYLKINYTIWNNAKTDGQTYEAYYNLATVLTKTSSAAASNTAFNEGWQNTLNITISPNKIDFDANVALWADTNTNELEVK